MSIIRTEILTIFTFLVFAFYNAIGIKRRTNTKIWHAFQYLFLILFIFLDYNNWINLMIVLVKENDFHQFGQIMVLFLGYVYTAVAVYVNCLHYFLPRVDKWFFDKQSVG